MNAGPTRDAGATDRRANDHRATAARPSGADPATGGAARDHGATDARPSGGDPPAGSGTGGMTDFTAEGGHGAVPISGVPVAPDGPPAAPAGKPEPGGPAVSAGRPGQRTRWPLFEVFVRGKRGLNHVHVGSLRAADEQMALHNARDVYTRRNEGVSIWVVRSDAITASSPAEKDPFFAPSGDKVYRHPTFYPIPDDVPHM